MFSLFIPWTHLTKQIPFLLTEMEKRRGYQRQILKQVYKTIKNLQTTQTSRIAHQVYHNIKKLCKTRILMMRT